MNIRWFLILCGSVVIVTRFERTSTFCVVTVLLLLVLDKIDLNKRYLFLTYQHHWHVLISEILNFMSWCPQACHVQWYSVNVLLFPTVPSAPADIKAVISYTNKILVSWLPPLHPNGQITGHTFYMGIIEDGKEVCDQTPHQI